MGFCVQQMTLLRFVIFLYYFHFPFFDNEHNMTLPVTFKIEEGGGIHAKNTGSTGRMKS